MAATLYAFRAVYTFDGTTQTTDLGVVAIDLTDAQAQWDRFVADITEHLTALGARQLAIAGPYPAGSGDPMWTLFQTLRAPLDS